MIIYDYTTSGGKNLIWEYIEKLPNEDKVKVIDIRNEIQEKGFDAFANLNARQLVGKLWEIKVSQTRIMYVVIDEDGVAFLNICKKQKRKAEKKEISIALKRAKEEKLM